MARVERSIDVGVPIETAYRQWTRFEDFPHFMHGVEEVRALDPGRVRWRVPVGGQEREWDTEITERIRNSRIAWRSNSGTSSAGLLTFQRLGDFRTRVMLQLEYQPQGILEVMWDALGLVARRVSRDLERFKEFVERRPPDRSGRRRKAGPTAKRARARRNDAGGKAPR